MDSIEKYLEESAQVAHEQKQLKSVIMIIANEVLKSVTTEKNENTKTTNANTETKENPQTED